MERLYIRGRILELLRENCEVQPAALAGEPAFATDADELARLVEGEFAIVLPPEILPEVLSVNWLVDVVHELLLDGSEQTYVM